MVLEPFYAATHYVIAPWCSLASLYMGNQNLLALLLLVPPVWVVWLWVSMLLIPLTTVICSDPLSDLCR